MKKTFIIISLITLLIPLLPTNKVFATVEAPDKPIEVDCPPSYVGQKKCFYVTNPKVREKTPEAPTRPAREVTPEMNMPEKKEVRRLPDGRKIFNHPYVYALWIAVGGIRAHSETFANIEDKFWNNVNEVDKMAGEIANKVSDTTAAEIQTAWENALISLGTSTLNLKDAIWNELFGATNEVLAEREAWAKLVNERWKSVYPGQTANAINYFLNESGYASSYEWTELVSVAQDGNYTYISATVKRKLENQWMSFQISFRWNGENFVRDFDNISSRWWRSTYEEARAEAIIHDDRVLPETPSKTSLGSPTSIGTAYPIVPMTPNSVPKIVEIDGKKYYQSPNETSPAHPDLEPMPELQPDGTQKKIGTKIPGHKLIDEDGNPIEDGKPQIDPITGPVTSPLNPGDPGYQQPKPPGEDNSKPRDRDIDNSLNKLKTLVTNKFPFSLPWDLLFILGLLNEKPVPPVLGIDKSLNFMGVNAPFEFSHTVEWTEPYMPFIRTFILIGYIIFLIFATNKLLGGAK